MTWLCPAECQRRAMASGLPRDCVRRAIRAGELPARRISPRRYAVREDDFERWLEAPGRAVEPECDAFEITYTRSF